MGRLLGITGTPGTGKKTIAPLVAIKLGVPCFAINDFVSRRGQASKSRGMEVDTRELRRKILKRASGTALLFGHLFPSTLERGDVQRVVVLRCDPAVLKRRLVARGYPRRKVVENVEAELIGLIAAECRMRYGGSKVGEVDTTFLGKAEAARKVSRQLESSLGSARIDWLGHYASAVKLRSLLSDRITESART